MWWDVLGVVIGIVVGLLTGFYFERRAIRQARIKHDEDLAENLQLREHIGELQEMIRSNETKIENSVKDVRESVYSTAHMGLVSPPAVPVELTDDSLLADIRDLMDASGKTSLPILRHRFIARGHAPADFDGLLKKLAGRRLISLSGKTVELR